MYKADDNDTTNETLTYYSQEPITHLLTEDRISDLDSDTMKFKGVPVTISWEVSRGYIPKKMFTNVWIGEVVIRMPGSITLGDLELFRGKKGVPIIEVSGIKMLLIPACHQNEIKYAFRGFTKYKADIDVIQQFHYINQSKWLEI